MTYRPTIPAHPVIRQMDERQPPPYGDLGHWSLLRWLSEGDAFLPRAIERNLALLKAFTPPMNRNFTRETSIYVGWAANLLKPHMTDAERGEWASLLVVWRDHMLKYTRLGDDDEVAGHLFGLLRIAKFLGDDPDSYVLQPGGYSMARLREEFLSYVAWAKGGEGLAGSAYSLNTSKLWLIGALLDGIENWPEVAAWAPQCAEHQFWMLTADRRDRLRWGDNQSGDLGVRGDKIAPPLALARLIGGDAGFPATATHTGLPAGCIADLIAEVAPSTATYAYNSWITHLGLGADIGNLPQKPVSHNPQGFRTTGVGLCIDREGNWLAAFHQPPRDPWVDHDPQHAVVTCEVYHGEKQRWVLPQVSGVYIPPVFGLNTARAAGYPYNELPRGILVNFHDRRLAGATATANGCLIAGEARPPMRSPAGSSWFPIEIVSLLRRVVHWDRKAKKLRVIDSAKFLREPPVDNPAAFLYTYPQEMAAIKSTVGWLEQIWQEGDYSYETTAERDFVEPGRFRLLADGMEATIDTTLCFDGCDVGPPDDPLPVDPPPVEPPPVTPPKPDLDVEFCGALLDGLRKGQADIKAAVDQLLDNQRKAAKAVK